MDKQEDGTYIKVYNNVAVADKYQFKVVENRPDGEQIWRGDDNGNNVTFNVKSVCDVTITFDPATNKITVTGTGVEFSSVLNVESMRAVGNGYGNWLNGVEWDFTADENLMTEVSPKVYEITYTSVEKDDDYQVKFVANGSWTDSWGGIYQGSGVESEAVYNGDDLRFAVPYRLADVTLRLDLSNYDHTTKTGATFTVTVVEHHDHVFTDTWEKDDTYHWHKCQHENCTEIKDQAVHSGGTATCTSKAICEYCDEEYGELDSSNHDLVNTPAKDATVTETGNKEYWQCENCKKYFADEKGTNEISLEDTVIQKLPPEIIKGKGQSVAEGEKKALSFTSNAAFSDFIRVELDGKTLDEKNYIVKEGSTIVTLKADYVATLSAGKHTIGIVSESGTATTTFIVNAKAVVDNDTKSPQTGDNSHMALWIALLFMSGAGVIGTTVYGKKKRAK